MIRLAALSAIIVFGSAAAAHESHHHHYQTHGQGYTYGHDHRQVITRTVTISCFRGPWTEVIWDRPEPAFLESLAAFGYRPAEALAIGETVCRDQNLVGNPEGQKDKLRRILYANPPRNG